MNFPAFAIRRPVFTPLMSVSLSVSSARKLGRIAGAALGSGARAWIEPVESGRHW